MMPVIIAIVATLIIAVPVTYFIVTSAKKKSDTKTFGYTIKQNGVNMNLAAGWNWISHNLADAQWIENNLTAIARALALSVTEYFGLPYLTPGPVRRAVVETVSGPLNLRGAPSSSGEILSTIPGGATVEILNSYNGWYVARYGGILGYVLGEYLRFI